MQKFAHIISLIFQPFLFPTYSLLILFQTGNFAIVDLRFKLISLIYVFILTTVIPLFIFTFLKRMKVISSIQLPDRKERTLPYVFTIISYIATLYFLYRFYMPTYILGIMIGVIVASIVILFINLGWKVSAHLASMGGFSASVIIVALNSGLNPSFLLAVSFIIAGFVAMARIVLNLHSLMQTLVGFLTGFVCVLFFGMII